MRFSNLRGAEVNRGVRALLIAAAVIVLCLCTATAQNAVSLTGIRAESTEDGAVIELITSGLADFEISRFTAGNWVSVWSHNLDLNGTDEIPLDIDRPELADLLAGASLVEERHRATVRIYLGPKADQRGVFIMKDGDTTKVYLPSIDGYQHVTPREPVPNASHPEQAPSTDSLDALANRESDTLDDSPTPTIIESVPQSSFGTSTTSIIEPQPPVELASSSANNSTGSFYVPRDDNTPEPATDYSQLPNETLQSPLASSSPLDLNPATGATVNYQMMPVDDQGSGSDNDTGNGASPPSIQDMLEEATELATEMLNSSAETDSPHVSIPTPTGLTTGGFMASPAQSATLSTESGDTPEFAIGKAALADIRIDLFEIVNSPLDQAITLLIAPTDYNIIVDSSVGSNSVSLSFKDSTTDLKSALDLITKAYGLEYTVQANTIVVAGKDKLEGGLISFETRLFVLSYADPKSVKDMLESTGLVAEGQVEIYAGEEAYTTVNDSTELSNESGSEQAEIKRIETNLSSTPRNAILVKAVPEHMTKIAQVIADIDRRPRLIELEVRVCQASQTALRNLGLELNNNSGTAVPTSTAWTEQNNENGAIEAFTAGSFYRSPMQFILQLNTQIQEGTVEVLAQPTLPTVEGKQAIFFAGERIPYIAKVSYTQTGQQIEVDFLNVGITLNFKPRLDADGRLTIDVNPIVSSLLEFRMIGDVVEAPRTSSRQLATTVHVDNMEPFVLAGLISEVERETVTKIPLLGDLPLLGKLFRSTNHKGERTEIIVVVVPRVIE